MEAAEVASDPTSAMTRGGDVVVGVSQWLSTRRLLEETRPVHAVRRGSRRVGPGGFCAALDRPERVVDGLRMLLAARRYGDVVLQGLAWASSARGGAGGLCGGPEARAASRRGFAVHGLLDDGPHRVAAVLFRQGFENARTCCCA